jgi:hypothetical protein
MTWTTEALTVAVFWLAASLSFCQNPVDRQPCPDVTAEAMGCELIAWSKLQEPVPLPLTLPDDRQPSQPERQERVSDQNTERHQSLQTVVGVVVKDRRAVLTETEQRTGSSN